MVDGMLVFDPFMLLLWIFVSSFLPCAVISLALLKDTELGLVEKILIGFGIGLVLPQFLPIVLAAAGIKYSFAVALAGVALVYVAAILLYLKEKPFGLKVPAFKLDLENVNTEELAKKYAIPLLLVLLVALTFWIRVQSYSPVFQELDPYFYTYGTQQILTLGFNPLDDKTAWVPEVQSAHRSVPVMMYMEALWYKLYTFGSGTYDNMLLAVLAGIYPPIAGALAVFFLYLLFASQYKREYALMAAAIASFIPIFMIKTAAGEMEIQPYAFFAVSFFLAMYAWCMREKDMKKALVFAALSIVSFTGLSMGSSSAAVAYAALIIFIPLQAIALAFKGEMERLKTFALSNLAITVIGMYLVSGVFASIYGSSSFSLGTLIPGKIILVLAGLSALAYALYYLRQKFKDFEMFAYAVGAIVLVGLLVFAFTPLKAYVSDFALSTVGIAKYNAPLQRTIAEQGTTGGMFQGMLGFMAASPGEFASGIVPAALGPLNSAFTGIAEGGFGALSFLANTFFAVFAGVLDMAFDAGIAYVAKDSSLLLVLVTLMLVALLTSFVRSLRKPEITLFLLFAAVIFPPALVGILKAKYTIYMGYFFAGAIAMVLAEGEIGLLWLARKAFAAETLKTVLTAVTALVLVSGVFFVYFQFSHEGFVPSILASTFTPRFQDNPAALKDKLTAVCSQIKMGGSYDDDICGAAADPAGYASKGMNYQYSGKLCALSLMLNPFAPTAAEQNAVNFRCQRITDYWIDSMEWIRYHTEPDSRTTSWWDYGHWINYFGQKNTVLRNEHASLHMIGEVAHAYIDGTPQDLIDFMKTHDSRYALFDGELVMGGNVLGGKYGALNYLSCARDNETNVDKNPGSSRCEANHLWEIIYVPKAIGGQQCVISALGNKTGVIAYGLASELDASGNVQAKPRPVYCLGDATLANGQKVHATYYLDKKYDNGDLQLNKAILKFDYTTNDGVGVFTMFYTKDRIWLENGQVTDGYGDRKGKFYDSNLYKAFFLKDLPGFQLVYETKNGEVKIYKMVE